MAIFPPSWQSWFKISPLRIHTLSFRALHVIPSAARNLPPSLRVRGLGGCPRLIPRHSRAGENPEWMGEESFPHVSPLRSA